MRKLKRILKIFRNNPFGIKEKYFGFMIERSIRKNIKLETKLLKVLLEIANDILIPRDEEEKEILKKVVKRYDETIAELERYMKYVRIYVQESED